jgi:amino acid transporter
LDVAIYPIWAAYYLSYFIPALDVGAHLFGIDFSGDFLRWVVSALIIWAISALQIRGARLSGLFTNWLGLFMITPLVILSILGIVQWVHSGVTPSLTFMPEGETLFGAYRRACLWSCGNYMGWELPTVAGDEIVETQEDLLARHGIGAGGCNCNLFPAGHGRAVWRRRRRRALAIVGHRGQQRSVWPDRRFL